MYLCRVVLLVYLLSNNINCHDIQDENTQAINETIKSPTNKNIPGIYIIPSEENGVELSTQTLETDTWNNSKEGKFLSVTDSSVSKTSKDWTHGIDACITGKNKAIINGIRSLDACKDHCQAMTQFVCRSVEYLTNTKRCQLRAATSSSSNYSQPCPEPGWTFTEVIDINGCSDNNGGCEQNCYFTNGVTRCSCRDGFALKDDSSTCQDSTDEAWTSTQVTATDRPTNSVPLYIDRAETTTQGTSTDRPANHKPLELCDHCSCDPQGLKIYCEYNQISNPLPQNLTINADIIPKNATFVRFKDFKSLQIEPETFNDPMLKLKTLEIENIPNMILEENSLSFAPKTESGNIVTMVQFTNCSFTDIKTGAINQKGITNYKETNEIRLHNQHMLTLIFKRCNFKIIRSHAITNARIMKFEISESNIEKMESESIGIVVFEDFDINYNNITSFVTKSIRISSTHTIGFSHNNIKEIQSQAFNIKTESQVKFDHNIIQVLRKEAFTEIGPLKNEEAASIMFLGNTIMKADPMSLVLKNNYPPHQRLVQGNRFNVPCSCSIMEPFQTFAGINENSTQLHNETLQALVDQSLCLESEDTESSTEFINIEMYLYDNCTAWSKSVIISASIASVLLLLVIIICIVCHIRVRRAQDETMYLGEICSTRSFSTTILPPPWSLDSEAPPMFPQQLVVPDVKTYHQTELNIPYENAESMASIPDVCSRQTSRQDSANDNNLLQQSRMSCPFN